MGKVEVWTTIPSFHRRSGKRFQQPINNFSTVKTLPLADDGDDGDCNEVSVSLVRKTSDQSIYVCCGGGGGGGSTEFLPH